MQGRQPVDEGFQSPYRALKRWVDQALGKGWINTDAVAALEAIEQQQAAALFAQRGRRPLIVAFFGGTGVGKSSLLNRLAGMEVARVGLQRPTSTEVTLYLHQKCQLGELPSELPLSETQVTYHSDDNRKLVAWLDMPDFDSVEERHRELVKRWLPYVDWVVYVVSPSRYLDDIGWRFLQQRGGKHAWMFVVNHWDQGKPEQIEHFRTRLHSEGFPDPLILRTSCGPNQNSLSGDDFDRLEQTINDAIEEYGLELLQELGTETRLRELYQLSEQMLDSMRAYSEQELITAWNRLSSQRLQTLEQELTVNGMLRVQEIPDESGFFWQRSKPSENKMLALPPTDLVGEIWGERMDTRLDDLANELENLVVAEGLPVKPFSRALDQFRREGKRQFMGLAEEALTQTLGNPDADLKTHVYKITGYLTWILPTAAAGWAIFHAVKGFYLGTQGEGEFLGLDFAIHAAMLIGLSWLLPWLVQRRVRPTLANRVGSALRAAIHKGAAALEKQASDGARMAATELREEISLLLEIQEEFSFRESGDSQALPWRQRTGS